MKALLKPDIARGLGVVLLKPGSELMSLFHQGRILIEPEPKSMSHLPSGRVPDARQPLAEDKSLESFFTDERVIKAAGGPAALEAWLLRRFKHCQWPHSDYHHAELVTMPYQPGAILLCWHCDNELRDQSTERLSALARKNVVEWGVDSILMSLRAGKDRELSIAELCWWAVYAGVADAIPEGLAARALKLPFEPFPTVYKESNIIAADNRPYHCSAEEAQNSWCIKQTQAGSKPARSSGNTAEGFSPARGSRVTGIFYAPAKASSLDQ